MIQGLDGEVTEAGRLEMDEKQSLDRDHIHWPKCLASKCRAKMFTLKAYLLCCY